MTTSINPQSRNQWYKRLTAIGLPELGYRGGVNVAADLTWTLGFLYEKQGISSGGTNIERRGFLSSFVRGLFVMESFYSHAIPIMVSISS